MLVRPLDDLTGEGLRASSLSRPRPYVAFVYRFIFVCCELLMVSFNRNQGKPLLLKKKSFSTSQNSLVCFGLEMEECKRESHY